MRLSRLVTVGLSVFALVLSLSFNTLIHMHTDGGHDSEHPRFRGNLLHSHLPQVRVDPAEARWPSFDTPSHDGTHIDLFLSLTRGHTPVAVVANIGTGIFPKPETLGGLGSYRLDRTHDPPPEGLSPRAPPA